MDLELLTRVIQSLAEQAMAAADVLAPVGSAIATSLLGLAIVSIGLSYATAGGIGLVQLFELLGWAWLARTLCNQWSDVIQGCLDTSNQALRMFGIDGPAALFGASARVGERLMAESFGWGLSIDGTLGAMARAYLIALTIPLTTVALAIPGLLALLAQVSLVLGSAAAPLLIPGLAFSVTRPLGWGVIQFMAAATIKIIVLGLISTMFATAITSQLAVPGTDQSITVTQMLGVWLTAIVALIAGFGANSISTQLVGGGCGGLGWGSLALPGRAISSTYAASGAAMTAAGAAARSGGGHAGSAVSAARSAAGRITSRSSGSAF